MKSHLSFPKNFVNCHQFKIGLTGIALMALVACGGGGGGGNGDKGGDPEPQTTSTGYFIDSPVGGMAYSSSSGESGTTGADGSFQYRQGDTVTFSIGGVVIGTAAAGQFVTPNDINGVSGEAIINIVRFLLTLDEDGDPSNGIIITPQVVSAANVLSLSASDFEVQSFESKGLVQFAEDANGDDREIVDSDTAESHLLQTETDLADGSFDGPQDADNDGVGDALDNCPNDANAGQQDTDEDGLGDACDAQDDTDSDGDGIRDAADNCPAISNSGQADMDEDGVGDACDPQNDLDGDNDGVENSTDNCPDDSNAGQADLDGDGIGDVCDPQDDTDSDSDGVRDEIDNCPAASNGDQTDTDGDGTGDACDGQDDTDTDSDGVRDEVDNCPVVSNGSQADIDNDGLGDACDTQNDTDTDSDGIRDEADNCPANSNADQADSDGDGIGDACDPQDDTDSDNDGIRNEVDNCPAIANDDQADTDGDGVGDACDPNSPPTAKAGDNQSVLVGDFVVLSGAMSSDDDGDELQYAWALVSRPQGSSAELDNPSLVSPSFDADAEGEFTLELIVSDGQAFSVPDEVVIFVSSVNAPPVADAGDNQNVHVGDFVELDGSFSSDADEDPLTFSWSFTQKPNASSATLDSPVTANPGFNADVAGEYELELVVSDGESSSEPDSVIVTASNTNVPPVADAGEDINVFVGDFVAIEGTGSSDADGDPLTYSWALTSRPDGSTATLSSTSNAIISFSADIEGQYVVSLTVNDGEASSPSDSILITAVESAVTSLHLWGGENFEVYLGCLTCGEFGSDSVCNEFGTYGSRFQSQSIWNEFGAYGSEFQTYSPWNRFSNLGPGIFDQDKRRYYGNFTVNNLDSSQTTVPFYLEVFDVYNDSDDHQTPRDFMCE